MAKKIIAIDTETTGLIPWDVNGNKSYPARPFAVSWCWDTGETGYVRFFVNPYSREVIYEENQKGCREVAKIVEDPDTVKVFHNAKFDVRMLKYGGWKVAGQVIDTMHMAHICTHGTYSTYGLKFLGEKFCDISSEDQLDLRDSVMEARKIYKDIYDLADEWQSDFWLGDEKLCEKYAVTDAVRTMLLYHLFNSLIDENSDYKKVLNRESLLQNGVLTDMENIGIRCFPDRILELESEYTKIAADELVKIKQETWPDFNANSSKDKQKIFIEQREFKPLKMTAPSKTYPMGQPKMDGEFLYFCAKQGDSLARSILEYRAAHSALTGFVKTYKQYMVEENKEYILHPQIRGIGPITGRLSSHEPNLMNVASVSTGRSHAKVSLRPRECLGPREGHIWLLADFSQIEVWVFAFLSQNKTMMDTLMSGGDFHGEIAHLVFGDEPDFESRRDYYRKCGKLIMFSTLYGGGVRKLSEIIPCTLSEAKTYREKYMRGLGDIETFMKRVANRAAKDGFIVNPYGRHCGIDGNKAYRAVNYLIQSTAADIQKEALIAVHDVLNKKYFTASVLMSLHDEQIVEVTNKEFVNSKEIVYDIIHAMQKAGEVLGVPKVLPVSVDWTNSTWHKKEKLQY